jgi:multiple sugar transport system substrate-binding protein
MGLIEDMAKAQQDTAEGMTRRRFLRNTAAVTIGGLGSLYLAGCGGTEETTTTAGVTTTAGGVTTTTGAVSTTVSSAASDDAKWKQFSGAKLVFLTENTPPSSGYKLLFPEFTEKTGIQIEMIQDDLPVVFEKLGIDLRAGTAQYQLNYDQDKLIGSEYADFWVDQTKFFNDSTLPQDPEGYADETFLPNYVNACGRYYSKDKVVGVPYDNSIIGFAYRKDIFEKFSAGFEKEYGYPMVYNSPDANWKNCLDWSTYLKKARAANEPYGFGLQLGNFALCTQLDVQRMLYAHGQWLEFPEVDDSIGSKTPGSTRWGDEQCIKGLELYNNFFKVGSPDGLALGPLELSDAIKFGKIGFATEFNEFFNSLEDQKTSVVFGKMAYDVNPKGADEFLVDKTAKLVNATNCGVAGIAINASCSEEAQKAAWTFVAWVTSKATQKTCLKGSGATPTRVSVVNDPEVIEAQGVPYPAGSATGRTTPSAMVNAMSFPAIAYGMQAPHVVFGPKIPKSGEYYQMVATAVMDMCAGKKTPVETGADLKSKTEAFVKSL